MAQNKEDNTVYVLQRAIRKFNLKVSDTSIKEFLLSHPHYPSLKSVCDALTQWKIAHYALKLEAGEIKGLEIPFIAHFHLSGGQLVFVEKIENGNVVYSAINGRIHHEVFETFSEKLSGAVIVFEADESVREKNFTQIRQIEYLSNLLLPIGILTLLLFSLLSISSGNVASGGAYGYLFWGLLVTKSAGFIASLFLIMHELKVHSPLADKICGFNSKTDSDAILSSNASQLFGWLNWADIGLIYFLGTFIYLLGSSVDYSLDILAIISAASLPYPVFSIWYQSVKLKKWCPFCLIVQLVLIVEFILLFPAFKTIMVSSLDLVRLTTSFIIPAALWIFFKAYYQKSDEFNKEHYSFLKFKRDPEIFRILLRSDGYNEFVETKNDLVFGNRTAPVSITSFLSLYCNPCAKAFKELNSLLSNFPDIKVNFIFAVYNDAETQKVINTLFYLYAKEGAEATIDFLSKWYSSSKLSRKDLYYNLLIPEEYSIAKQIGQANLQLFEKFKIAGTPTIFINGYKFPNQYAYTDIQYYINDIIK
jgi:uncharacterized membrane protein